VTSTPSKEGDDPRGPSMSLYVYGNTAKTQLICSPGPVGRVCPVPLQSTFSIDVKTGPAPSQGFQGYQIVLQYTAGLTLKQQPGLAENRWPPCTTVGYEQKLGPTSTQGSRYILGCKGGPPPRTFKGILANVHFNCTAPGTQQIDIIGGGGSQVSFYDRPSIFGNRIFLASDPKTPAGGGSTKQVADAVRIQCGTTIQGLTAGDSDGDGCSDKQELSSNALFGGLRDSTNPWDFFDPTGDGLHRLDDILAVLNRYGQTAADDAYSTAYDRTYIGPYAWNLGPPNGNIGVTDLTAVANQYRHDCV
jgi:hypothetical protein